MKEDKLDPTKTHHQYINYDPDDEDSSQLSGESDDSNVSSDRGKLKLKRRETSGSNAVGLTVGKFNDGITTNNDFKSQTISDTSSSYEGIGDRFEEMMDKMKSGEMDAN